MRYPKLIKSVIVIMFLNAVSVMYAQSQKQPLSANLDSVKKANTEMWLKSSKKSIRTDERFRIGRTNGRTTERGERCQTTKN